MKGSTKYTYDGLDVIQDDDSNTGITKYQNGLGIDNKLKLKNGSNSSYFLADHLGSTNGLVNSSGNLTSSASYDSFGNKTGNLNTRYQFTGREKDDVTGLYYYRARWYDSKLGRFISEDPIGFAGGDVNLYGYVGNNPQNFTDPLGLSPSDLLAQLNEAQFRAEQKALELLETPITFLYGVGDTGSGGLTRSLRQWQGLDEPSLDCSTAYQAGEWFAFAVEVAEGGYGLYKAAARSALKQGAKSLADDAAEFAGKGCLRCFEAETEVQTAEGSKPIEQIDTDDEVLSYNELTGELEYQKVLHKMTRYADDIYSIKVEGESRPLGVTSEHPFFVKARDSLDSDDDGEWRETRNLKVGDEIRLANGSWAKIRSIKFKGEGQVYNFTVEGNHNYFVGDLRLLTHNIDCVPYEVGTFNDLKARSAVGDGLDIHHAPQKHPAGQVIPDYNPDTAPAIALPFREHRRIPNRTGNYSGSASDLFNETIDNLRQYTNTPQSRINELADLYNSMYR